MDFSEFCFWDFFLVLSGFRKFLAALLGCFLDFLIGFSLLPFYGAVS